MYIGFWAVMGTMYLIYLTYQDYKNNMRVDGTKNAYMFGLTTSLYFLLGRGLLYFLLLVIIVEFSVFIMRRYRLLGEGDVSALRWIWYGYGLLGWYALIWFIMVFAGVITIVHITKRYALKYEGKTPFFGQILIMYVVTALVTGAYSKSI